MTTIKLTNNDSAIDDKSNNSPQGVSATVVDWSVLFGYGVTVAGLYLDAWAHKHLAVSGIEDFFTPWHLTLYSGLLLNIITMAVIIVINRRRGLRGWAMVPAGYQISLVGIIMFALGGAGDMVWHGLFGLEEGFDAGYSPTHLVIAIGIALIVVGPIRSGWQRRKTGNLLPVIVSATMFWALLSVLSLFIHPFVTPVASNALNPDGNLTLMNNLQGNGLAAIMIQTVAFSAIILLLSRRWQLPFGGLTIFFGLNGLLLSLIEDHYFLVIGAILGGLLVDIAYYFMQPLANGAVRQHQFAFLLPFLIFIAYFLNLQLNAGIWWTIHLWLGSTVLAGFIGLGLSYLTFPPAMPSENSV